VERGREEMGMDGSVLCADGLAGHDYLSFFLCDRNDGDLMPWARCDRIYTTRQPCHVCADNQPAAHKRRHNE